MEEDVEKPDSPAPFAVAQAQYRGRTTPDLVVSAFWILLLIGVSVAAYFGLRSVDIRIPWWVGIALLTSFLWRPFLHKIASMGSMLILVDEGPSRITEYRVGARFPLVIDGQPLDFYSESGVRRIYLTNLEIGSDGVAYGSGTTMEGFSQFDFVRDVNVLRRINEAFMQHLRGERMTKELIGLKVEEQVGNYSETWLRMLYGELDPSDIEKALLDVEKDQKDRLDALHEEVEETGEVVEESD
jgi:hypothetical protein